MTVPKLLGEYRTPALARGSMTHCLYRDCEVKVTTFTDAPISWPRCPILGQQGGSGLLMTEELKSAVLRESSIAIKHWWAVSVATVWAWRKAFGVEQWETEGSKLLLAEVSALGAAAVKEREFSAEEREAKRVKALELDLAKHMKGKRWPKREKE